MARHILILTESNKNDDSCTVLAKAFAEGAYGGGNEFEIYDPAESEMYSSNSAYSAGFASLLNWADALVFSVSADCFSFTEQFKTATDKLCAYINTQSEADIWDSYMIVCGACEDESSYNEIISVFNSMTDYMRWDNKGFMIVKGADAKSEISVKEINDVKKAGFLFEMSNYRTL